MCVFRFNAPEAQSVLCLSVLECAAQARTHISAWGTASRVDCTFNVLLIKQVQQFSNCKDGILQQSIDLILTLSFGQGGTNAHCCEWKDVVLEETQL